MFDNDTKFKFIQLRANGKSYASISEFLKVSQPTLLSWGKEFVEEITELKKDVLEQHLEKCGLTLINKMELFKKRLHDLEEEIDIKGVRMRDYKTLVECENKYIKSSFQIFKPFIYPSGKKNVEKSEVEPENENQQEENREEEKDDKSKA